MQCRPWVRWQTLLVARHLDSPSSQPSWSQKIRRRFRAWRLQCTESQKNPFAVCKSVCFFFSRFFKFNETFQAAFWNTFGNVFRMNVWVDFCGGGTIYIGNIYILLLKLTSHTDLGSKNLSSQTCLDCWKVLQPVEADPYFWGWLGCYLSLQPHPVSGTK